MKLFGRAAALLALKVPAVLLLMLPVAALRYSYGAATFPALVGLVFGGRWVAGRSRRSQAIPAPYLPRPAVVRAQHGWYWTGWDYHRAQPVAVVSSWFNWVARDPATWRDLAWMVLDPVVGTLLLVPAPLAPARALRWHGRWTRLLLAPTDQQRLEERVRRLTATRAEALDAQAAELERIERDLHDGAQARLIAIGLTLSLAQRSLRADPAAADELLTEARAAASAALTQLRDLVRGIRPPVLTERGLVDAVRLLGLEHPLDVTVTADLPGRLQPALESAVYFATAELLTNVAKHAAAHTVTVDITLADGLLRVTVTDDGRGGADPAGGTGLEGVRRRLRLFDGTLDLASGPGGPTAATLEVPCGSSWPKTSSS